MLSARPAAVRGPKGYRLPGGVPVEADRTPLYRIEHLADARHLSADDRASLRQERSQPVLEKLKRCLLSTLVNEPPSSELAKATGYILNQWTALSQFVEDGRLNLDNNLCEQQLRDIALGARTTCSRARTMAPAEPLRSIA